MTQGVPSAPSSRIALMLVLGAACDGHRASPPELTAVLSTIPVDGATDVEPDGALVLQLRVGATGVRPGDVTIRDGGNELPGTLTRIGQSQQWRWQPQRELPRGNRIRVHSAAQGEVASFTVREAAQREVFALSGESPAGTLTWPNGRHAVVMTSGRVFEVTAGALIERFVAVSASAWTFGDGDFVGNEAGVIDGTPTNDCVRGNLDGTIEHIPTPYSRQVASVDSSGDAVLFVPSTVGAPGEHGIWRLLHDAFAFELAGPLELDDPDAAPGIDGSGAVSLAYAADGELRFARFAPGDLAGERYGLATTTAAPRHAVGIGGGAVIAWTEATSEATDIRHVLHLARYQPGAGVRVVSADAGTWTTPLPTATPGLADVRGVHVGDGGSAVIVVAVSQGGSGTAVHFVRLEPDDSFTDTEHYATEFAGLDSHRTHWSPGRCEMRVLSPGFEGLSLDLARSRPGEAYEPPATVYTIAPPHEGLVTWFFSFDDCGRSVIATTESVSPGVIARIARFD